MSAQSRGQRLQNMGAVAMDSGGNGQPHCPPPDSSSLTAYDMMNVEEQSTFQRAGRAWIVYWQITVTHRTGALHTF
jgi:hypothetical protein